MSSRLEGRLYKVSANSGYIFSSVWSAVFIKKNTFREAQQPPYTKNIGPSVYIYIYIVELEGNSNVVKLSL